MDYGKLYDQHVADTYDDDALGLLSGARNLALQQIATRGLLPDPTIVDLGVGTGESLLALTRVFPGARLIGIDLSARMIAAAQRKLVFDAHVDDACNAGAHVAAASVDLVLAHFLTTFVDRARLFNVAATALKPGGLFSVVSTPSEAFYQIRQRLGSLLGSAAIIDAASPTPENSESLAAELRAAGFEVQALETFRRKIVFQTFDECVNWGLKSGFFAHSIEAIGLDRILAFSKMDGLFPLEDEYVGVAILAAQQMR